MSKRYYTSLEGRNGCSLIILANSNKWKRSSMHDPYFNIPSVPPKIHLAKASGPSRLNQQSTEPKTHQLTMPD